MLSLLLLFLTNARTFSPFSKSCAVKCEPINPVEPVTNTATLKDGMKIYNVSTNQ